MNSVLSAIPTYWMSIFRLPNWVIKEIDRIRMDFLWIGPDIDKPKCQLVDWKSICRPRDLGGWGILDLKVFNSALLGKWWWKLTSYANWCGRPIVQYNYGVSNCNLHFRRQGRDSFFWSGIFSYLPALRECTEQIFRDSSRSLFCKDNWLFGQAPMNVWPDTFLESANPNGTIKDLIQCLERAPFREELDVERFLDNYNHRTSP